MIFLPILTILVASALAMIPIKILLLVALIVVSSYILALLAIAFASKDWFR